MTNTEGIAIIVMMKTHIVDGNEEQTTSFSANGRLFKKNDMLYIQFQEENVEKGAVNQVIKIDDRRAVTVIRQGVVSMKQQFSEGEKSEGIYRSSLGNMFMETMTKKVDIKINENEQQGTIILYYDLHMQNQFAGNYEVTINFRRNSNEYC